MTDEQPIIMVCGVPQDAPPEVWAALAELGRAAMAAEDLRRAALTDDERAAEDMRRAAGRERIRARNARLRREGSMDRIGLWPLALIAAIGWLGGAWNRLGQRAYDRGWLPL